MEFKNLWDLASAMQVLSHDTVDSKLWAEAVEWLIQHGPPEIQKLLIEASASATTKSFPELKPSHITADGEPYYNIKELAASMGITEAEVRSILKKKEADLEGQVFHSDTKQTIH